MAIPLSPASPPIWMTTLAEMKLHGTRLRLVCTSPCTFWEDADIDALIEELGGEDYSVWDAQLQCERCGQLMRYVASPGPGTPFRPLVSDPPDRIVPLPVGAWMAG